MISRRHLLQMLGLGAGSYFLPSLGGHASARADAPPIPRRILFFFTEQGTLRRAWRPSAPDAPDELKITSPWSTSGHTLGELHQPLVPYKDRLLFLDGIDMASAFADPTPAANGHAGGETHALVAQNRASDKLAGGTSIDQFIAKAINSPSPVTRLPSLELHVGNGHNGPINEQHPIYAASGEALPITGDPSVAYDRMFPNGPVGTTPEQKEALARSIAEQRAILDFTKNEFSSLSARLGKADRERLSAHAAAVSDLSSRLALGQNAACLQPDRSIVAGGSNYEVNADMMMRLVQTAFACDLTRVATLYFEETPESVFGYESVEGTFGFHDMIHKTANKTDALYGNPKAEAIVKRYYSYLAGQFAKLIGLLESIPEADGGTLLDHTVIVWCGQLAAGDHTLFGIPYVLAGRLGGALTPGRYVRYPRTPDNDFWPSYSRGPAHNDLFVALANGMGVSTTTFGNAAVCKGPLAGLK